MVISLLALWWLQTADRLVLPDLQRESPGGRLSGVRASRWGMRGQGFICCASQPPAGSPCSAGAAAAAPPVNRWGTGLLHLNKQGFGTLGLHLSPGVEPGCLLLRRGLLSLASRRALGEHGRGGRASVRRSSELLCFPTLPSFLSQSSAPSMESTCSGRIWTCSWTLQERKTRPWCGRASMTGPLVGGVKGTRDYTCSVVPA